MKSSVWRWTFWIALIAMILLILFEVGIWALGNATAAMLGGIMGSVDPNNFGYKYLPLDEFMVNSVGSPIFYCYVADLVALLSSIVGLTATRKTKS